MWYAWRVRGLLLGLWVVGCAPEVAPSAPVSTPVHVEAPIAAGVAESDRGCERDADCTAIATQCSMCEGACTGVRVDRADQYGALDCSQYRGELCNYDCRPRFNIEAPRCVNRRCESVRVR